MSHRLALQYIEIDVPAFDQPDSPPNSPLDSPPSLMTTYRFAVDTAYLPSDIAAIPSIRDIDLSPAIISLGENLGQRATVTVKLRDHKHIFTTESFDSGTFWGKFRARYGLKLQGSTLRLIHGFVGDDIEDMETRTFIIETTDGPSANGEFKIVAKDLFKLADGDRAQAPMPSNGFLSAGITIGDTSLTLSPSGIGDEEYPVGGYLNIGGKEIAAFLRDSYTKLLLHGDGTDASTTITDSSPSAHTIVLGGNAQLDTAQFKFGSASILFDGVNDFIRGDGSTDFAFGTGDWTVELWVRLNATGIDQMLYDSRPSATDGAYPEIFINTSNVLIYVQGAVIRITGATALTTGQWYHVAAARTGTSTKLFLDGTQEGSTYSDSTNYLIGANRPAIGINATDLTSNDFNGWMDDIRVRKGIADYTANFTPPTAAHELTAAGDVLTLTRAQYNTVAVAHEAQSRVQLCLEYLSQDVADVINDLMISYADIGASMIPLATWQAETGEFLNVVYSALIAEPTAVNKLISELIEQAGLVVWWDDLGAQFRLQVLRAISTAAAVYDGDVILMGTLSVTEQPSKRLSQVYTYFAKINPLLSDDQLENYRSTAFTRDIEAEAEYGAVSVKKIYSRWIPIGGRSVAETVNDILLSRFRDPPRRLSFNLFRDESGNNIPSLGGGYQVGAWCFQDQSGAAALVPVQLTSVNPLADHFEIEAEEMLFNVTATSPDNHVIIIDANVNNVDLRAMHDSIYATPVAGDTVTCTIAAGVTVGSTTTATPAFDVGTWPASVTVNLIVLGRIQGMGGAGGKGGDSTFSSSSNGVAGKVGGKALYTRQAISLNAELGAIWGGAGGGGGGGAWTDGSTFAYGGGGGGGGAGTNGGPVGNGGFGSTANGTNGKVGTATAGGVRGFGGGSSAGNGGNGGGPGLAGAAGSAGASSSGAGGGAAGSAIDGVSFVSFNSPAGDIRGGQIN